MSDIAARKTDHLDLTAKGDVGFRDQTTLLECVRLVHDSVPELALDQVDLSCRVFGRRLKAPLLIAGMTGGTERAGRINQDLSQLAERRGYAFGLGSQRPMLLDEAARASYQVRRVAPEVLLLGNIGAVQAAQLPIERLERLVADVEADALCVHLNPAMELVQAEGDRNFVGCEAKLAELARDLSVPLVAKETGCGLSASVAKRLRAQGVRHVDVSGAGGTSWVAVETQRAPHERRALGELFWDWGIPTAASVAACARQRFETIFATGGVKNGLEVAQAIALGATAGGIARPVLQAYDAGGVEGAERYLCQVELELRTAMLLVGAKNLRQLRACPKWLGGELSRWLDFWASQDAPT